MVNATLKIGEVAKKLATSIRTIRYYEEEGLIQPIRTAGGTRLYTEKHIVRLKSILNLTKNGFSIEAIRLIGRTRNECKTGDQSSKAINRLLNEAIDNTEKRIEELENLKAHLLSASEIIQKCLGCTNKPNSDGCTDCQVRKHLKDIEILNLIWDNE